MNIKKRFSYIIIFLLAFAPFFSEAQSGQLTKAIKLFDEGKYTEAEPLFKEVLNEKPNDFMVNYFYGACRTENYHFTNSDLECLIKANEEVSPVNISYYFGMQYHARSNWERALKYYTKFKSSSSEEEINKKKVLEKIQQCYDKINPYKKYIVSETDTIITTDSLIVVADSVNSDTNTGKSSVAVISDNDTTTGITTEAVTGITISESTADSTIEEKPQQKGEQISFYINPEISYTNTLQFKTEEGKSSYISGIKKQKELKETIDITDRLRSKYSTAATRFEKNTIGQKILANENRILELKNEVSQLLLQAKNAEDEYWKYATPNEIAEFLKQQKEETAIIKEEQNSVTKAISDTPETVNPAVLLIPGGSAITEEKSDKNELIYKIQLGAYKRKMPSYVKRLFDKLSKFRKIDKYTDEKGVTVYTTGELTNYNDALKMKNQVKQEGVKDAKVVAYFKGKRITLEEAKKVEAEK